MPIKVFYHVKARQDFYDLIRSTMPADRYELLTMEGDSQEERLAKLAEAELVIVGGLRMSEEEVEAAGRLRLVLHQGVGYHDTVATEALMKRQIRLAVTPQGTSEGVAEHAIMMMLATGRRLAFCDSELREGRWHSNTFRSTARQLFGATVGIIGLGRIGKQVAKRLIGFETKTIYTDLLEMDGDIERELRVTRASFEEILTRSDFITLHVPMTDKTRGILNAEALAKTKKGVRIINCARGGLVDEAALKEMLESGHVAGAALDVFAEEPAKDNVLFGAPNFICTPHLGASTTEAQVNVALQVAEQLADYLVNGGVTNALNMPSLSAEEAPKLRPYMGLAEKLGSLVGQLAHGNLTEISIERSGAAADLNGKPIEAAVLAGFMKQYSDSVNMVNAPYRAKERGLDVRSVRHDREGVYHTLLRVTVATSQGPRSVAGTLFGDAAPRLVEIFGIGIEADLDGHMLYIVNEDAPGFIGRVGTLLGEAGINIGTFHLGRREAGGEAVLLLSLDSPLSKDLIDKACKLPGVKTVMPLAF